MWVFILIPNLIWLICIFYVLYQDKIESDKKILYLLILNLIFIFSDLVLGNEFINDMSIEIVTLIIEFIQLFLITYWVNKKKITSVFTFQYKQSNNLLKKGFNNGVFGLIICLVLIGLMYFLLVV